MSDYVARKIVEWRTACAVCFEVVFLTHGATTCAACQRRYRGKEAR